MLKQKGPLACRDTRKAERLGLLGGRERNSASTRSGETRAPPTDFKALATAYPPESSPRPGVLQQSPLLQQHPIRSEPQQPTLLGSLSWPDGDTLPLASTAADAVSDPADLLGDEPLLAASPACMQHPDAWKAAAKAEGQAEAELRRRFFQLPEVQFG